jgi:cytochrome c-type biogenesis protein CcmF
MEGKVVVSRGESVVDVLYPQKRQYRVQTTVMTEAGIDWNLSRDLFVAMGDDLGNGAWSLRLQYKPYLRFVWLGALLMAFGGLLAVCDRRYRVAVKSPAASSPTPPVPAAA